MPPKSPKGKKKLTKAEKEKLKKEEAERKLKEEEEAAIEAEKEAAARKEKDKQEAEERRRLENEERIKRKGQLVELESLWEGIRTSLLRDQAEIRKNAKWERYMRCDGSPDPTIPGEINTYMNLWSEDTEKCDIETTLKDSDLALSLIAELEHIIDSYPSDELPETEVQKYKETTHAIQNLLAGKLDLASHDLTLKASALANPETMNLQKTVGNDAIALNLWGNLSKNPRIKSFEFEEQGFTFEMPKLLTLSDIAIRCMVTQYDHYSPQCKTFAPRIKKKVEETPTPEEEAEKKEEEETEEKKEGEGEEGASPDLKREETEQEEVEENKDVMAALRKLDDEDEEEEKKEEEEPVQEDAPMEEDYEIKTPEPIEFEDFEGEDDVIDLRAYQIVGGIYHFDLLHLPPQPKNVNTWTITQVLNPAELRRMEYVAEPIELNTSQTKEEDLSPSKKKEKEAEKKKEPERPPIGVVLKLPNNVYFSEEPQVVRWNDKTNEWCLEGFSEHKYDEENRVLNFKTNTFGTLALIQDTHINMPFQSWEIRPKGLNHCQITIIAAIVEAEIEIKDDQAKLAGPADREELSHLLDKWMPVPQFVKAMKAAGINLFPSTDSSKYVSIQNKSSITEDRLYQQMAMTASSMAFSWSKWNTDIKQDEKIVIQGSEQMVDEPLLEEDWSLFLITKKRTTKLKMTEFDETFAEDHAEGTGFQADLYHMTMDISSEEAKNRITETSYQFVNAVYDMLQRTRLVTYS